MISERATNTNLFRKRKELEISYAWETKEHVVFEKCESDDIINDYFLIENFVSGEISVTDSKGNQFDKTDRILNLFLLNI
jgi:hypothetical protein